MPLPEGGTGPAIEVPVLESIERWSEFHLEDGTVLRVKFTLLSAARIEGRFDSEGNPVYVAKGQPVTAAVTIPDELKQKKQ